MELSKTRMTVRLRQDKKATCDTCYCKSNKNGTSKVLPVKPIIEVT